MQTLTAILMRKYCDLYTEDQLRIIASELSVIFDEANVAYDLSDHVSFRLAILKLKRYKPPFPQKTA